MIKTWYENGQITVANALEARNHYVQGWNPSPELVWDWVSKEESDWILRKMKTVKCNKKMKEKVDIWNFSSRPALTIPWRLLWWQWFCIRRRWCRASTSKQRTRFPFHSTKNKKRENGGDIEQGSSLAVVLNQNKQDWSYKNFFSLETWNAEFIVREMWNGHFIVHETWSIPSRPLPPSKNCHLWMERAVFPSLFVCVFV